MISGLPESTLRYYEQIGIIDPIARDPSSGHRAYTDEDIQSLVTISCLSATGMPLEAMREYLKNRFDGNRRRAQANGATGRADIAFGAKQSIRMQAYVSKHSIGVPWREGHDDLAQRLLEENHDVIETVKNRFTARLDA